MISCEFNLYSGKTRKSSGLKVCSLITRVYDKNKPMQDTKDNILSEHCDLFNMDNLENREKWLAKALEELTIHLLNNEQDQPKSKTIYIEGEMLTDRCDAPRPGCGDTDKKRWTALRHFVWNMATIGLSTAVVLRRAPIHDDDGNLGNVLPFPGQMGGLR